jgi:hypothetical protein
MEAVSSSEMSVPFYRTTISSTLKMEATCSSKTLLPMYKNTRFHIPKNNNLNIVDVQKWITARQSPSTLRTRLRHISCRQPYGSKVLYNYACTCQRGMNTTSMLKTECNDLRHWEATVHSRSYSRSMYIITWNEHASSGRTNSTQAQYLLSYSRISQHFMELEGSLPYLQLPATGPYPKPHQSSPRPPILYL